MTARRRFTILLSSAGRRVSLLRTLRDAVSAAGLAPRVIACDMTWAAPAIHHADEGVLMPACTDPDFPDRVRTLCFDERVDLVVPTIDTELPVWSRLSRSLAADGTTVAVSSGEAVETAADKRQTNDHCRRNGLPCPRQGSVQDVLADPSSWTWPVIVKPLRGSASHGLRSVGGARELSLLGPAEDLVVEELAAGIEYTVDVYADRRGVVHGAVPRRRLATRGGEVSKAVVKRDGALESIASKVVETLPGVFGPLNVQLFSDGQQVTVIEINARFGGGYPLTWRAGGRHGEWLVREVAYGESPPLQPAIEDGLLMLRWDEEVFVPDG